MDSEVIDAIFTKYDDEYIKFEKIPDSEKLHKNRRLCAFLKIASLSKDPEDFDICAEHDEIFLAQINDLNLAEEDILYLTRCGVRYCSENDCLAMFV